jgi:hypothetical protein
VEQVSIARGEPRCECCFAAEDSQSQAYNEEAFQYFLTLEEKRTGATGESFLLVLVDRDGSRLDPTIAAKLLRGLKGCFRETDYVGWYREGRVAGAVLTEFRSGVPARMTDVIGPRVQDMLERQFSKRVTDQLQVHIYEQPEPEVIGSANPGRRGQFHPVRGVKCSS